MATHKVMIHMLSAVDCNPGGPIYGAGESGEIKRNDAPNLLDSFHERLRRSFKMR